MEAIVEALNVPMCRCANENNVNNEELSGSLHFVRDDEPPFFCVMARYEAIQLKSLFPVARNLVYLLKR